VEALLSTDTDRAPRARLAAEWPYGDALGVANLTRAASALAFGTAAFDPALPS